MKSFTPLKRFGLTTNRCIKSWLSEHDYSDLGRLICENILVVFKNQSLSKSELVNICKKIGKLEKLSVPFADKEHAEILLVTNKKSVSGKTLGMFGDGELGWHSNGNSRSDVFESCVALYCVKPGENTVTTWVNTRDAYRDTAEDFRSILDNIILNIRFKNNTIYRLDEKSSELEAFRKTKGFKRDLIYTHPVSKDRGYYFPYNFIDSLDVTRSIDINEIDLVNKLKQLIFQEKYMTEIQFDEGDLVFSDQLHSLHRRTSVEGERLLYRLAFNYDGVSR